MCTAPHQYGPSEGLLSRRTRRSGIAIVLGALVAACGSDPTPGPGDDPCGFANPISVGTASNGSLSNEDCARFDGRYVDRWSLQLSGAMTVRIDLTSNQFDTWLELQDDRGSTLQINDDAGPTLDSRIVEDLAAGSYVIITTSYAGGATGGYQLSVEEAADCSPVGSVSVGETVQGTLTNDDCIWEYGTIVDNWSLSIGSTRDVRIILDSDEFEEGFAIEDERGNPFNGAATQGPGAAAVLDVRLQPGDYTIVASTLGFGETGSYELTVAEPPPCGPGTAIELDVEVEGALTEGDCWLPTWGTADSYTLELDDETSIDMVLKSADFPPVIVVRDGAGTEVAWGHEYSAAGTATLRAVLEAGSYEVMPTTYYSGARGAYRLTVTESSCEVGAVELGDTVSGTITDQGCLLGENRYYDSWSLTLDASTNVQIDLTSSDFDAYLVLRDDAGTEIMANDDGGTGTDARIVRELEPGTYEVVAGTWGQWQFGDYDLTVVEGADTPPAVEAPAPAKRHDAPARLLPVSSPDIPDAWWVADPDKEPRF